MTITKQNNNNKILIVGLGNRDTLYQNTRHNAGYLFIDYLAQKYKNEN